MNDEYVGVIARLACRAVARQGEGRTGQSSVKLIFHLIDAEGFLSH